MSPVAIGCSSANHDAKNLADEGHADGDRHFPEQLLSEELPAHLPDFVRVPHQPADHRADHRRRRAAEPGIEQLDQRRIFLRHSAPFPVSSAFRFRPNRRRADADDGPVDLALILRRRTARADQISAHHPAETVGTCRRRSPTSLQGKGQSEYGHRPQCGQLHCSAFRWRF
ncbi:hypothetical protein SM11_pC0198 (plasmid) [Sinorhizobium meliloti SM11]|uniref:Uncharacterized protein n=1 Tax=Sinorhizobium meliloti (strain SM11) TaxID=707241 RepID=F7XBP9_SINMM|nr:hypothetical protein SM11_pC0198 [Sinorhizobium meliloti SM11]